MTWDDVVVFTFHVLPHLCGFFFNSEPLRGVAQGTYIGVGSAHYFCKQEADPYFGMNGVADRVDRPEDGSFCGGDHRILNEVGYLMKVKGLHFGKTYRFVVDKSEKISYKVPDIGCES